jgi:hypothetical protein
MRRPLRHPIDETIRRATSDEFSRRHHQLSVPAELHWDWENSQFTLRANGLVFTMHLTGADLVVDAELVPAATLLATQRHREEAAKIVESTANDLSF